MAAGIASAKHKNAYPSMFSFLLSTRVGRGAMIKAMAYCHAEVTFAHLLWSVCVFGEQKALNEILAIEPTFNFLNTAHYIAGILDPSIEQSEAAKKLDPAWGPSITREFQKFFQEKIEIELVSGKDADYVLSKALLDRLGGSAACADLNLKLQAIFSAKKTASTSPIVTGIPSFVTDITKKAEAGHCQSAIGRDGEIRSLIETLARRKKANPVLLGDAGVGKTAVVEELARMIASHRRGSADSDFRLPPNLQTARIYEVNLASLMSGTGTRGSLEGKLQDLLTFATSSPDVILFIDEIHLLAGVGQGAGSLDAGNILKPALAAGDMRIIGASTEGEYRRSIEKDDALARRFAPIQIKEPSREQAIAILERARYGYEKHHQVFATYHSIVACVELSMQYLTNRSLPDKAFDLLDETMATVKIEFQDRIAKLLQFPEMPRPPGDFIIELWPCMTPDMVRNALAKRLSRPVDDLPWSYDKSFTPAAEGASVRLAQTTGRIIGQQRAISVMRDALDLAALELNDPAKPKGSFFCVGPSGVGKTELAKEFAKATRLDLVRIDMSEFQEKHSVSRLLGSPPGYVGFDADVSVLSEHFVGGKGAVLLIDEIEKAHPDIAKIFLQILDAGRLTDTKGRELNFTNSFVVFTSNLGASDILGMAGADGFDAEKLGTLYRQAMRSHFAPEFIGRIKDIVPFSALSRETVSMICKVRLASINSQMLKRGVDVFVTDEVVSFLADRGYSVELGARPLERVLERDYSLVIARAVQEARQGNGRISVSVSVSPKGALEARVT